MKTNTSLFDNYARIRIPRENKHTSRITNSVNLTAYKSFNKWGGMTTQDMLSYYPEDFIEKCWNGLGRHVIENYQSGKGTFIKGFGTFTFTDAEYSLEGTTNQYDRDIKKRKPVFIVSKEFIDYLFPGLYTEKSGLMYYTNKIHNNLNVVKINYTKISLYVNTTKEECSNTINSVIKSIGDEIQRKRFKEKRLDKLGIFILRQNIFGMKFDQDIINKVSLQPQRLYHVKQNLKFYMETKDAIGMPHKDLSDVDQSERQIRPSYSLLTKLTNSGNNWLKENMDIEVDNEIENATEREDLKIKEIPKNENEKFLVDQRFYRQYPLENLRGLEVPINILESIYKNKSLLIRDMKFMDKHGDGLIPKYDFMKSFIKTNVNHQLRMELLEKIVSAYLNNDENIIMIQYKNFMNILCKDIKKIIDEEYSLFPIEKYAFSIPESNKRANSQNKFSLDSGNLEDTALNSVQSFTKLPRIIDNNIKDDIDKIIKILPSLQKYNFDDINKNISFLELLKIFEQYHLDLNKIKILQILKHLDIQNPNSFKINDFLTPLIINNRNSTLSETYQGSHTTKCSLVKDSDSNDKSLRNKRSFGYATARNGKRGNLIQNRRYNISNLINGKMTYDNSKLTSPTNKCINLLKKGNSVDIVNRNLDKSKKEQRNKLLSNSQTNNYTPISVEKITEVTEDKTSPENNKDLKDDDFNFEMNALQKIRSNVLEYGFYSSNKAIAYFDKLLDYQKERNDNIITRENLEKAFKLENYDFSGNEINKVFDFLDFNKDGIIDRNDFINAMKKVQHPISTIQNYIKKNKLTINDIAYKFGLDLYSRPLNEILNTKFDKYNFQVQMKKISDSLDCNFILTLFEAIYSDSPKNEKEFQTKKILIKTITVGKIFEIFDVDKNDTYKDSMNIKNDIIEKCCNIIPQCTTFDILKEKYFPHDPNLKGKVNFDIFINILLNYVKNKIDENTIKHYLRINQFIDIFGKVNYHDFLMSIFIGCRKNLWKACIEYMVDFLEKECNKDPFVFCSKINNMGNNTPVNKYINKNRFLKFLRLKFPDLESYYADGFDCDGDNLISMYDIKDTIMRHYDSHYFDNENEIKLEKEENQKMQTYSANKKLYIDLKELLNKINMTEEDLFQFLDSNKDDLLDKNEFIIQFSVLVRSNNYKNLENYTHDDIAKFYEHLDEYKNNKVDLINFKNKLRKFNDDVESHFDYKYKGNFVVEDLILTELKKFIMKNKKMADTEIFPILDKDHDGKISLQDLRYFCSKIINISEDDLTDMKLLRFIQAVSENKTRDISLSDFQKLLKNVKENNAEKYFNNIKFYCNEGINEVHLDMTWVNNVIDKIGLFINENYLNDIEKFYNEYNITNFANHGQGLSFDNFERILNINHKIIESYSIKNTQKKILFNYISNNADFITLEHLKNLFENKYDFYTPMHNTIINFLHNNFKACEDAFKFFQGNEKQKRMNSDLPNLYQIETSITQKEFFDGINLMFPGKYETNTLLNYYDLIFSKKGGNKNIIAFNEFNYIYYGTFEFNNKFITKSKNPSKIKTTRDDLSKGKFMSFNSPFTTKEHKTLETPYDMDPLEKLKKIILSSKVDFKNEIKKCIEKSSNGLINQFEFHNLIKKFELGLTNIEIEDIIKKSRFYSDNSINLIDFYRFLTEEAASLNLSKKHILDQLKEFKALIYKYYTNPRLAFEMNEQGAKTEMDFDTFKKLFFELYKKEKRIMPSFPVLKYVYDFIDIRKDGIIDLNEWNTIFSIAEGNLDITCANSKKLKVLREWETSNDLTLIYKLIAKNKKTIKDKVKLFALKDFHLYISVSNFINILKNVLGKIRISQTQWKMLVSIGVKENSDIVDFNLFINIVDTLNRKGI